MRCMCAFDIRLAFRKLYLSKNPTKYISEYLIMCQGVRNIHSIWQVKIFIPRWNKKARHWASTLPFLVYETVHGWVDQQLKVWFAKMLSIVIPKEIWSVWVSHKCYLSLGCKCRGCFQAWVNMLLQQISLFNSISVLLKGVGFRNRETKKWETIWVNDSQH